MDEKRSPAVTDEGSVVSRDPAVHSGDLVFAGTRVPVEALIDHLKGGQTIDDFLEGFPTVQRAQVEAFLDMAYQGAGRDRE